MEPSKNDIVIKKANDHWAFLEHIEAPMWADLTLEANSVVEDTSDEWFNRSHLFHQWSAGQLKSKFSHPGEEILTSEVDSQGPASPELPSSVSRSRGKHFNSKKWGGVNLNILLDKHEGLSRKCFLAGSSSGQEVKPKTKSNIIRPKGLSSAKFGLAFDRNARGNASGFSNPVSTSSSGDNKTVESNKRSTITSENTQQQQKYKEVSSQSSDQKSGSSSVNCFSLRKSCVTKDSKVEVGDHSIRSRGSTSSSGKSSVGSCSNLGHGVKFVSKLQGEKITDGKGVVTMNLVLKNRCKPAKVSQTYSIPIERAKSINRKGSNINFAKPAHHRTAKSLVQYQTMSSRALLPSKVSKENSCNDAKEKLGTSKVISLTGKGKEIDARNVAAHHKCTERGVSARAMLKNHRTTERNLMQKSDTARSAAFTVLGRDQGEVKNPTNHARRIYLR